MKAEELKKIAKRYAQDELKDSHSAVEDVVEAAFLNGIDYAENHPHWISVEDELPICNIPYIDWTNEPVNDLLQSKQVIVLTNEGSMHIATLNQNYDVETNEPDGEPYWFDEIKTEDGDWINKKVTHWIYLSLPNKK